MITAQTPPTPPAAKERSCAKAAVGGGVVGASRGVLRLLSAEGDILDMQCSVVLRRGYRVTPYARYAKPIAVQRS